MTAQKDRELRHHTVLNLVNARMSETGEDYQTAWNSIETDPDNAELFASMKRAATDPSPPNPTSRPNQAISRPIWTFTNAEGLSPDPWPVSAGMLALMDLPPTTTEEEYVDAWERRVVPLLKMTPADHFERIVQREMEEHGWDRSRAWEICQHKYKALFDSMRAPNFDKLGPESKAFLRSFDQS